MQNEQRPLKVFLSYASQDRSVVRELSRRLADEGWIDPWLDEKKLLPGQDWRTKIEEAVETSDIVIICLSSNSVTKEGFVQKELRYAREIALEKPDETIFLIPLRLDNCETPRGLRFYQWADYFSEKREEAYSALIESLKLRHQQKLALEVQELIRKEKMEREREVAEKLDYEDIAVEKATGIGSESQKQDFSPELSQANQAKSESETAAKRKPNTAIFVTAISVVAIVLTAVWNSPLFRKQDTPTPSPTVTDTTSIPTPSETTEPSITPTVTVAVTPTLLPAEIQDIKGVLMHLVPAGEFTMGFSADQAYGFCQTIQSNVPWANVCHKEDYLREEPVHKVYLDNFFMDVYEVSNGDYQKCVSDRACMPPTSNSANRYSNYYNNEYFRTYPVIHVTWDMAETYCEWRGARLPSEAEWEKAARGIDGRTHPWGNYNPAYKLYNSALYVNKANVNLGDVEKPTMPVDSNSQGLSPYKLYNMAGNVAEWVSDWYSDTYYAASPPKNPLGPSSGVYKVVRGGSVNTFEIRTTARDFRNPSDMNDSATGFRCAKDANP